MCSVTHTYAVMRSLLLNIKTFIQIKNHFLSTTFLRGPQSNLTLDTLSIVTVPKKVTSCRWLLKRFSLRASKNGSSEAGTVFLRTVSL